MKTFIGLPDATLFDVPLSRVSDVLLGGVWHPVEGLRVGSFGELAGPPQVRFRTGHYTVVADIRAVQAVRVLGGM
jgi:hypothetical protein